MKKLTKLILSLALVLTVLASATNYQAAEDKGVITCSCMYDWNFGSYQDVIAFMSLDGTQTMGTLTGQQDTKTFGWFKTAYLELDAAKNVWVVKEVYTEAPAVAAPENPLHNKTLGEGKMVLMFHENLKSAKQADYDFYMNNLVVGKELKLSVDPSALYDVYDYVDGASFTVATSSSNAGSNNAGSSNAGSNNAGSNNAGSNVPSTGDATPVVAMASMLFVAVAFVALGLKKRNA